MEPGKPWKVRTGSEQGRKEGSTASGRPGIWIRALAWARALFRPERVTPKRRGQGF